MYLVKTKTMFVEALTETFDQFFPNPDFQQVHIGVEYPVDPQKYPSIWIDYEDTEDLVQAGVAHIETVDPDTQTDRAPFTRWRFQGYVSITVVAMTSLECDRLYDEVVRVVAFGGEDPTLGRFASYIDRNGFIALNLQTDRVQPRGAAAAPGTPWSTDELMYERTLNVEVIGEFIPDVASSSLVPLSKIVLLPEIQSPTVPLDPVEFGVWH